MPLLRRSNLSRQSSISVDRVLCWLREVKGYTGPFLVRYKPGKGPQEATTCWHTPGIAYAIKTPAQMCSGNYDTAVDYGYHEDNPRESFKFCPCEPVGQ